MESDSTKKLLIAASLYKSCQESMQQGLFKEAMDYCNEAIPLLEPMYFTTITY